MTRKKPTPTTANQVLYESMFVCVICQQKATQIHHIDGDHSNSIASNLVALCPNHHDEAHTFRENTNNLNSDRLNYSKKKWTDCVAQNRLKSSITGAQPESNFPPMWGYLNHNRLTQIGNFNSKAVKRIFETCKDRMLLDEHGIVISQDDFQPAKTYTKNSIYDQFEPQDSHRIHVFYSKLADEVSRTRATIHLEDYWLAKSRIETIIKSGSQIFINEKFYFKSVEETQTNDHRLVHRTKGKIKVQFYIDTQYMYGSSSMAVSFKGRQSAAALLIVKSINEQDDGILVIECTPLALGIAFDQFYPDLSEHLS